MHEIRIFNLNLELVAILENSFNVSYEKKLNQIWKASFSLPYSDPKVEECTAFRYVEIWENDERVDLFRILPINVEKQEGPSITFECEHVIATLLDDVLFQYHQIGGLGVYTNEVLEYILNAQTVPKWTLGTCSFSRQFEYKFENEKLLPALFSIPKPFDSVYQFTYNTEGLPWVVNLEEIDTSGKPISYIKYKKNLKSIMKTEDPTGLFTRIYPLGYGEGANQLTISGENNGIPYLDAGTQNKYGIISSIWVDRRFENAETLKAMAQALLNEYSSPKISYQIEAAELYEITRKSIDKFLLGTVTQVIDEELGEEVKTYIVGIAKNNIDSDPWNIKLELTNKVEDLAGGIAGIADKQRINEVYSQGATNLYGFNFADNADPTHPATLKFYIPSDTVRINKIILAWGSGAFRAYSTANATQPSQQVTSSVKASAILSSSTQATDILGSSTKEAAQVTSSTKEADQVTSSTKETVTYNGTTYSGYSSPTSSQWPLISGGPEEDPHYHNISHGHEVDVPSHLHDVTIPEHNHTATIPSHNHTVTVPSHSHTTTIPAHNHTTTVPEHNHTVTVPEHSHNITYGIYEGPSPTALTLRVDGNIVTGSATSGSKDITNYLAKDGEGKITRGVWHTLTITPNALARIIANISIQLFIQSRGGGDY